MNVEAIESFRQNGYIVITKVLNDQTIRLLREYTINTVKRADYLETYHEDKFNSKLEGTFGDGQVNEAYYRYGDPLFDSLLPLLKGQLQDFTGLNLVENYTYWRMYETGNILERHVDRYSCEISATMCIGYDSSNLKEDYNWPIGIQGYDGEERIICLNPGDLLIYRGCDLDHWRDEFKGLNQSQVFLHYNTTDSASLKYDGRHILGIPKDL